MELKDVGRLAGRLNDKVVLLRIDANVPIEKGVVAHPFRLERVRPTIDFLLENGARVIMISHHGGDNDTATLKPVADYFGVPFGGLGNIPNAPLVLLENLRKYGGEESNERQFVEKLASLADIFVNDAFAASHREHASIVGVSKILDSYAGFLLQDEVKNLSLALNPARPSVLILGGAKFKTKIKLISRLLPLVDRVFIAGAIANTFFKESGLEIGDSSYESGFANETRALLDSGKIVLPADVLVSRGGKDFCVSATEVRPSDIIYDNGLEFLKAIKIELSNSKFVLWNGPLGFFERGYKEGTLELARLIADSGAKSIVGGGDTLASIEELSIFDKFSFVSTGGGAMLDFLIDGDLPGLLPLREKR